MRNWVSVDKKLPEKDGFYWCYISDPISIQYPQLAIQFRNENINGDGDKIYSWLTLRTVTHWQMMPSKP